MPCRCSLRRERSASRLPPIVPPLDGAPARSVRASPDRRNDDRPDRTQRHPRPDAGRGLRSGRNPPIDDRSGNEHPAGDAPWVGPWAQPVAIHLDRMDQPGTRTFPTAVRRPDRAGWRRTLRSDMPFRHASWNRPCGFRQCPASPPDPSGYRSGSHGREWCTHGSKEARCFEAAANTDSPRSWARSRALRSSPPP